MRFCTNCGYNLEDGEAPSSPPTTPARPPDESKEEVAERMSRALGGPLCGRCRGVGDPGAEFCKFCGTRYEKKTEAPVAAAPAPAPRETAADARLVAILKDGTDGPSFDVKGRQTDIGRTEGEIILGDDPYLSPRHARIRQADGRFYLLDLASLNGVYVRVSAPVSLQGGDMILIGQQVLRFETLSEAEQELGPASLAGVLAFGTPTSPRYGRLVLYTTEGIARNVYYLYLDETVLGRENGDIVFTDDPFLSRRHAAITRRDNKVTLSDLSSSNGTSFRIRSEQELVTGDQFRIGRHLFRFENLKASH